MKVLTVFWMKIGNKLLVTVRNLSWNDRTIKKKVLLYYILHKTWPSSSSVLPYFLSAVKPESELCGASLLTFSSGFSQPTRTSFIDRSVQTNTKLASRCQIWTYRACINLGFLKKTSRFKCNIFWVIFLFHSLIVSWCFLFPDVFYCEMFVWISKSFVCQPDEHGCASRDHHHPRPHRFHQRLGLKRGKKKSIYKILLFFSVKYTQWAQMLTFDPWMSFQKKLLQTKTGSSGWTCAELFLNLCD